MWPVWTLPSCGSVFKNPSADRSAGSLIEAVGLKGVREGGAEISSLHANWIVNIARSATAADVLALQERCARKVREQYGIELESEVLYWG